MPEIPGTAADWLIAEFDATDLEDYAGYFGESAPGPGGSVVVQPIFALKGLMDAGEPMRVARVDYDDPERQWL